MQLIISLILSLSFSLSFVSIQGADITNLTIEEKRIKTALKQMPDIVLRLQSNVEHFENELRLVKDVTALKQLIEHSGNTLWKSAISSYVNVNDFDDRPLYWARLQFSRALRQSAFFISVKPGKQQELLWHLEILTRGSANVSFDKKASKKILVTGFDPFFLDRHIDQSNPSGAVAMALDNSVVITNGITAEVESLIVPVRFEDFDKGMIEELLTPYLQSKSVDMIITVSMGRDDFDLERFPGLRRSAKAPDNLNVYTGADKKTPLIPLLNNKPLNGPEFLEFSLPLDAMIKAEGAFTINDNHKVSTLKKTFSPNTINELSDQVSVSGSGGGYLSNEISYRSLLLRDMYYPKLPVGHIHTPRFKRFEPLKTQKIIDQIKEMISFANIE